ncbi:PilZ domain-containing protein [Aurantivibrio plasticivorans]
MTQERRRFFRITDTVGVAYRILEEGELPNPEDIAPLLAAQDFSKLQQLINSYGKKDPELAIILKLMNAKMTTLINELNIEARMTERMSQHLQEVNISACGMGFHTDEQISVGQVLALDMVLYPSDQHVHCFGELVASEPALDGRGFYTRVNFTGLDEYDRELLIQHIVQRQSLLLRNYKQHLSKPSGGNEE